MRSPFELPAFIDWLEKQPADGAYNWESSCNCVLVQYATAMGFEFPNAIYNRHLHDMWAGSIAFPKPWTFGSALTRARALLAQSATRVVQS